MKRPIGSVFFSLILFSATASAQSPQPDPLASLSWLAGDWFGTQGPVEMEERWTEPRGGMMLGIHREVKAGKAFEYEFFRIQTTPDGIVYFASPQGRTPTPFKLIESKEKHAVFENPAHDFPKRILYWRADDGALHARIEGNSGDKEKAMEWTWKKGRFEK